MELECLKVVFEMGPHTTCGSRLMTEFDPTTLIFRRALSDVCSWTLQDGHRGMRVAHCHTTSAKVFSIFRK